MTFITRAKSFHFDVKVLRMLLTKCGDFSGKKKKSINGFGLNGLTKQILTADRFSVHLADSEL